MYVCVNMSDLGSLMFYMLILKSCAIQTRSSVRALSLPLSLSFSARSMPLQWISDKLWTKCIACEYPNKSTNTKKRIGYTVLCLASFMNNFECVPIRLKCSKIDRQERKKTHIEKTITTVILLSLCVSYLFIGFFFLEILSFARSLACCGMIFVKQKKKRNQTLELETTLSKLIFNQKKERRYTYYSGRNSCFFFGICLFSSGITNTMVIVRSMPHNSCTSVSLQQIQQKKIWKEKIGNSFFRWKETKKKLSKINKNAKQVGKRTKKERKNFSSVFIFRKTTKINDNVNIKTENPKLCVVCMKWKENGYATS